MSRAFDNVSRETLSSSTRSPVNSMALLPVTPEEVLMKLQKLETAKAVGVDGISNAVLKNCRFALAAPLAKCINISIETGIFPDILKRARVVPIFKGGSKTSRSNYRPVSVIPGIGLLYEGFYNDQLVNFFRLTGFLTESQYGFRQGSDTSIAAIELMDRIYNWLDEGSACATGLFIDMKRAFDSVVHRLLLQASEMAGVRGLPLQWLSSFLENRVQAVSVNGIISTFLEIKVGVPQGSCLGSTLFLTFFNDIADLQLEGLAYLFADDTAFIYFGQNTDDTCGQVNRDTVKLTQYFASKRLTINLNKTKYMHFHSPNKRLDLTQQVFIDGTLIERVESIVHLGLHLDPCLTWKDHCENLSSQIKAIVAILFKLKDILPRSALLQIYFAFVHSRLNYMVALWGHAPDRYIKPLQVLQNRCLKIIYKLDILTPSSELYSRHAIGILPIKGL